ncbi:MAG: F0F1 ATP synthase subunit B [Fibrobacterales bacterium]|nr:F0F1 ATP synthase subunit B [Fibrobacterales bacterium]
MSNPLLQLDPGVAVWTLAVFALLLVVLKKVAWGPLLSAIDARDEKLRRTMEEAERTRVANESAASERDRLMRESAKRADEIVAEARSRADELARRSERAAREERERILETARKSADAMLASAKNELRLKVVDATVGLASKLLVRELDVESDRRVVERMMDELEKEEA